VPEPSDCQRLRHDVNAAATINVNAAATINVNAAATIDLNAAATVSIVSNSHH
jgi:hypothetical protein